MSYNPMFGPDIIGMLAVYCLPLNAPEHVYYVAGLDYFPLSSLDTFLRDPGHTPVLECFVSLESFLWIRATFQFFDELQGQYVSAPWLENSRIPSSSRLSRWSDHPCSGLILGWYMIVAVLSQPGGFNSVLNTSGSLLS